MQKFILSTIVLIFSCGFAAATPSLYFADVNGNTISQLSASAGQNISVYIYGSTDEGNTYDYFNLGVAYDPDALLPMTGVAAQDLVMSTSSTFGAAFGLQETTYNGTSLLNAAASSMSGAPAGFGPTLLATAHFTFSGTPTQISMFNEADDYNYSTYFMDTQNFSLDTPTLNIARFSDTLTITAVPEPVMTTILVFGVIGLIRKHQMF